MYELKRLLKRHIEENLIKYILILTLVTAGILFGFIFSRNLSRDISQNISQSIGNLVNDFPKGFFNKIEILKTSFLKSLRISLLIFLGGLSAWMLPISFSALLSYGFSLGFTAGYLSSNFGGKGLGIVIVSIFFAFLINIPTYTVMGVVAFNNSKYKKYSRSSEGSFGVYAFIFGFVFLLSMVSVLADAFLVPEIITLICR